MDWLSWACYRYGIFRTVADGLSRATNVAREIVRSALLVTLAHVLLFFLLSLFNPAFAYSSF